MSSNNIPLLRSILIRLRSAFSSSTYVELKAPASVPANITFTVPGTLPGSTQALTVASDGTMGYQALGGGGSVTSVGLSAPAPFTVSGSPVTASGTLALGFASQSANTFLAAPNGSAGSPTMRAIVIADIASLIGTGANTIAAGNDSRFHTQNSDTGTTALSFQLNTGSSGVRLKDSAGALQVRNSADSANADLVAANVTVSGNLTVQGTTTTVESETLTVNDNIIVLNNNVSTGSPTENGGIEVRRGASASASLLWDETADQWFLGIVGSLVRIGFAAEQTFVNSDLAASIYTWNHNLGRQYFPVVVIDNNNKTVGVEATYVSSSQLTIDLTGFGTLTGTWRVVAG